MNGAPEGMMIPLGRILGDAPRSQPPSQCGLANILYHREFWIPRPFENVVAGESGGKAVILTYENNGYLLWLPIRVRDDEGDWIWERGTPEFLPPGREDARDRAAAVAASLRAERERGFSAMASEASS